jgi:putative ABC transport system substrate-binding protein
MLELAEELVRLRVDIIVAPTSIYTEAAKRATSTIPIIFMSHADPIRSGHAASLARPGGNITGLSGMQTETAAKGVELLKDAIPELTRIAVVFDPATPSHGPGRQAVEVAAAALGLELQAVPVATAAEFDSAFAAISREHAGAVLVLTTPLYTSGARRLAELAIAHRLPSMFGARQFIEAGGLLSFGPDRPDMFRRGAVYVDKILKGASPADLPVEQPTKFELIVNLNTRSDDPVDVSSARRRGHRMNHRDLLAVVGGTALWPLAAQAQPASRIWRIRISQFQDRCRFDG